MKILIILISGLTIAHAALPCPRNPEDSLPVCDECHVLDLFECACVLRDDIPYYLDCFGSDSPHIECNQNLAFACRYPGEWQPQTCSCECKWWAHLLCQKNQYFDHKTCQCKCKEPCKDCSRPQIWSENVCNCVCPYKKNCLKNQFWSEWSCDCQCKQKPRRCCEGKIWSQKACDCVVTTISTTTTTPSTTVSYPPIPGCDQSILKYGECLYPRQTKISCNGCFKMLIENGNLVIRYNTAANVAPVFIYQVTNGQTAKICAGSDMLSSYDSMDQIIWNNGVGGNVGIDARILDNGQVVIKSRGPLATSQTIGVAANCYVDTTTTTISTNSSTFPCIGNTIYVGQCLYPGQALCSKNGCFKMFIENGDLVVYRTSDMSLVWKQPYSNGGTSEACALTTGSFSMGSYNMGHSGPSDATLTDDGQLFFILQSTGQPDIGNLGIGSSCNSKSICQESIIDAGECFTPGQVKVSCNKCFKMVLEGGNLVIYHNDAPGLPPVWTYSSTNGQAAKACGLIGAGTEFIFYSSTGTPVWGLGPPNDAAGVMAKILDNGKIVFAAKNTSMSHVFTYGPATNCYNGPNITTTTTPSTTVSYPPILTGCDQSMLRYGECLYPGQSKISCNGCFKILIENGNLVIRYNTDANVAPVYIYHFTNNQTARLCAELNTLAFYSSTGQRFWSISQGGDAGYDVKILDNGKITVVSRNPTSLVNTFGNYSISLCYFETTTTTPSTTVLYPPILTGCDQSMLRYGECLYPGQSKISCNGCFKILIENGNLVIRYNTAANVAPVYIYHFTNNQTAKICAELNTLAFYSSTGQRFWSISQGGDAGYDVKILDNGQITVVSRNPTSMVNTFGNNSISQCYVETTTTTAIITTSSSVQCIGDTILVGQCLYPGQALCSKNGCFKMFIENGDLVVYRTSDMSLVWKQPYSNGGTSKACALTTGSFSMGSYNMGHSGPSDALLTDDGQLFFILQSTGKPALGNLGIGSSCNSKSICQESIIDAGECFTPGQVKVSCNKCFKMVLEGGNLVIYYNDAPGLPPVWTYSSPNGQAAKACGLTGAGGGFNFYSSTGTHVWGEGPPNDAAGVMAKILDNGQIVFASKNTSMSQVFTYGPATRCYLSKVL